MDEKKGLQKSGEAKLAEAKYLCGEPADCGEQVLRLAEQVVFGLRERQQSLSLAESCTGGRLSSAITSVSGASQVFYGSFVTYANELKERFLFVSASLLKSMGAVSLPVAKAMARGARQQTKSVWSVAVTGIAGPSGGSAKKPVGTVCFAVCGPGVECVEQQLFVGTREQIQSAAVDHALKILLREAKLSN